MTPTADSGPSISRDEARRLYETSDLPRKEIAARLGIQPTSLSRIAREGGWSKAGPEHRRALAVKRIRERVDQEIETIETVLRETGGPQADGTARTLASLVRSLRELQTYDAELKRPATSRHEDADDAPADLDALRDALAERLERFRRQKSG